LYAVVKIHVSDEITPNTIGVVDDSFYFNAKLNGSSLSWIVPSKNNQPSYDFHSGASYGYNSLTGQCNEDFCFYLIAFTQIFKNAPSLDPQINVGFNMATQQTGRDEYLSWFTPGFKNYGLKRASTITEILDPRKNGVIVYYIDPNGKSWSSISGSQLGSIFESVSLIDLQYPNSYLNKIWKAKFSCKLYDDAGNWINVENAEIYNRIMLP
ncbi:MAG TPA: hypothetical protein VN451_06005, partial [Chitinophagaceae bacterium]|nr:hypothetical protein [Chitinophagaceae bacterium]